MSYQIWAISLGPNECPCRPSTSIPILQICWDIEVYWCTFEETVELFVSIPPVHFYVICCMELLIMTWFYPVIGNYLSSGRATVTTDKLTQVASYFISVKGYPIILHIFTGRHGDHWLLLWQHWKIWLHKCIVYQHSNLYSVRIRTNIL